MNRAQHLPETPRPAAGARGAQGGERGRHIAVDRAEALALGANAVIAMRLTTSTVMAGAAEILAYGTAVIIVPGD